MNKLVLISVVCSMIIAGNVYTMEHNSPSNLISILDPNANPDSFGLENSLRRCVIDQSNTIGKLTRTVYAVQETVDDLQELIKAIQQDLNTEKNTSGNIRESLTGSQKILTSFIIGYNKLCTRMDTLEQQHQTLSNQVNNLEKLIEIALSFFTIDFEKNQSYPENSNKEDLEKRVILLEKKYQFILATMIRAYVRQEP